MKFAFTLTTLSVLSTVLSAPAATTSSPQTVTKYADNEATGYIWDKDWNRDFTIHPSCNESQTNQIQAGIEEAKILAAHARDHTLKFGNLSEFYQKYFGSAAYGEVIGWYDAIVNAEKSEAVFRCDNPDGNCANDGWAGHWRGENATNENVICDLSYTSKLYLSQMCTQGYTVANSKTTTFWSSDLLHRVWHTDVLGLGVVGHYADDYTGCLELAKTSPEEAVRNSNTLRYYALDVYAYDIAVPGKGCTGEVEEKEEESASSTAAAASSSTAAETEAASSTTSSDESCHTHSDGEVHCE